MVPFEIQYHAEFCRRFHLVPQIAVRSLQHIELTESRCGAKLPESVREFYLLAEASELLTIRDECGMCRLEDLLASFESGTSIEIYGPRNVNTGYQAFLVLDGSDDPRVRVDGETDSFAFSHYVLQLAKYVQTVGM